MPTTPFQIRDRNIEAEASADIIDYIRNNINFFSHGVLRVAEAVGDTGVISFLSLEEQWSFACRAEAISQKAIAHGEGVLSSGSSISFDAEILKIESTPLS